MANRSSPSSWSSVVDDVLTHAQDGREVVQDFVPLAESLEWGLGQQYFRERGSKAFTSDKSLVPFVINNNGTLSRKAAEVFFASLVEADNAGTLARDINVLEIGIGVGLFARFFLSPKSRDDLIQRTMRQPLETGLNSQASFVDPRIFPEFSLTMILTSDRISFALRSRPLV